METGMKLTDKILAKLKKTKIAAYLKQKVRPRHWYWYAHYYKHEPVKENTILYFAYRNNIMGGNPYAIFRELMDRSEYRGFTHIWVYGEDKNLKDDTFDRYVSCPNVICVKLHSREHCRWLAKAQYIICNSAVPSWAMKKADQIYINTWHGTPLKTLGRNANDRSTDSIVNAQRNFFFCDYIVMPNRYTIDHMIEAYDLKNMITGTIVDAGYPRIDLVRNASRDYIRGLLEMRLGRSLNGRKIVLYAPTFRSAQGKSVNNAEEVGGYMRAMLKILPENCELFFKVHNMMAKFFSKNKKMRSRLIFDEIETNELLSATDILITDYSSIFFDFICTKRPVLFFAYDRQEYADGRGVYLPLEKLPGAVCETIEELEDNLHKIKSGCYGYDENYSRFLSEFAYNDDGRASQRVVDIIFGKKGNPGPYIYKMQSADERVLVVGKIKDSIQARGECIRVARENAPEKNTVAIMAPYVFSYSEDVYKSLENIRLVGFELIHIVTFMEKLCQKLFHCIPGQEEYYQRQYRTYFGDIIFSRIIDLNGSGSPWKPVLEGKCGQYEPRSAGGTPEERAANCESVWHVMTVLLLATFDSVNYLYINLFRELEKRGYSVVLVVRDSMDEINNRMFFKNGISFVGVDEFGLQDLDNVDMVVCSPFSVPKFSKILGEINKRNIFCIGFTNLFSSILMQPYTDLIFSVGRSKFDEFKENGLHYNMVSVGNPQYDGLVGKSSRPRVTGQDQIKRVLFMDQGGYPFGTEGKKLLGEILITMAKNHPDKSFTVKPRYLPDDIAEGKILHRPSEHIYDFIPNPPDNLVLLREAVILEDIIADYDAAITMWSTAYLDAAMLNMPIMLISQLPSEDIIDVRVQRINEAYKRLQKTGCVVKYEDILEGKLEFHYVDEEYLKEEVENVGEPATPVIVDILEQIYKKWIVRELRPCEVFEMNSRQFREGMDNIATMSTKGTIYRDRRSFIMWFNTKMQEFAFLNRAMAKPFDLSPLKKYWFFFPDKKFNTLQKKILKFKVKLTIEIVKMRYFCSQKIKYETDGIRLDYYYDWLFRRKLFHRVRSFNNPDVYPETRAFYSAMICLKEHNYPKAAKKFSEYYHITEKRNVKPIAKDRKIELSLIPDDIKTEKFFEALFAINEFDVLKELCTSKRFDSALKKMYLTKVMRAELLNISKTHM